MLDSEQLDATARSNGDRLATVQPLHQVQAPQSAFLAVGETLEYTTSHALEFLDITQDIDAALQRSGVAFGQVAVYSTHTTAAIVVNEHEPLLLADMARVLSRTAPAGDYYAHNDFSIRTVNMNDEECANGHAHCQQLFLGASETIPVHEGELRLGRYQRVFLVELDHARRRSVFVQALGLGAQR
jgi:secondary thiamine-phosphate synthase enzyme